MISSEEYHDKVAAHYDADYTAPYWFLYHEITRRNMREFLPERRDLPVLDAGGGTGYWAFKLAEQGYDVVLSDISQGMLDVAAEKVTAQGLDSKIKVVRADIRDMNIFDDASFSFACAQGDAVSYCLDAEKAIAELARVVTAGGHVSVSVDNKLTGIQRTLNEDGFDGLEEFLRTSRLPTGRAEEDMQFPTRVFDNIELAEIFRNNGLEPVKTIGKPVLVGGVFPVFTSQHGDPEAFERFIDLEMRYNADPRFLCQAPHFEMIGRKE